MAEREDARPDRGTAREELRDALGICILILPSKTDSLVISFDAD